MGRPSGDGSTRPIDVDGGIGGRCSPPGRHCFSCVCTDDALERQQNALLRFPTCPNGGPKVLPSSGSQPATTSPTPTAGLRLGCHIIGGGGCVWHPQRGPVPGMWRDLPSGSHAIAWDPYVRAGGHISEAHRKSEDGLEGIGKPGMTNGSSETPEAQGEAWFGIGAKSIVGIAGEQGTPRQREPRGVHQVQRGRLPGDQGGEGVAGPGRHRGRDHGTPQRGSSGPQQGPLMGEV